MTYLVNGMLLGCIWFVAINVAASVLVATVARSGGGRFSGARSLLLLRLAPAAVSLVFVAGIFAPSYWWLEPRDLDETFGVAPVAFVVASGLLLATAIRRGVLAYRRAIRCSRTWLRTAHPVMLPGITVPVFVVDGHHPGMTLVGMIRPRVFIARPLFDALSPEELQAALAHEIGHHRARDNFKRLLIECAPDLLSQLSAGRRLAGDWALASEHAADGQAACTALAGLSLASALVKAARLMPRPTAAGATSPLVGGAIADRVHRLTRIEPQAPVDRGRRGVSPVLTVAALVSGLLLYAPLLRLIHEASELFAHALP